MSRSRVYFVAPPHQEVYRCGGVNALQWRRHKRVRVTTNEYVRSDLAQV